jgi:hypothetical protein
VHLDREHRQRRDEDEEEKTYAEFHRPRRSTVPAG